MGLHNDLVFTEGKELSHRLIDTEDPNEIADIIDNVATKPDLARAVLMFLTLHGRGIEVKETGVEIANKPPSFADLILPPGVYM